MCGIAGYIDPAGIGNTDHITSMVKALSHRGPDSGGTWIDKEGGCALGHRRLSIIDLSPAGSQPMSSRDGNLILIFNGEIYNHKIIRKELNEIETGIEWRGGSDTETLLEGFARWGIPATLRKCTGMFAFALWNRSMRTVTLGRDRIGEKPLYYGWSNQILLFASELKAMKKHPSFNEAINRHALALYLKYSYVPAPFSIYQKYFKLQPGAIITFSAQNQNASPTYYWEAKKIIADCERNRFSGSLTDAIENLERLLTDSIRNQMIADVPLGAFLSGGVDSSTIVGIMQSLSSRPISTFTIGFEEKQYNEANFAKQVSQHLQTEHNELYVTPKIAMNVIPSLPDIYCEPFADSSQIPTYLVSKLASRKVKVCLSGDAGDELFAGYDRYLEVQKLWQKINATPRSLKIGFANLIRHVPAKAWNNTEQIFNPFIRNRFSKKSLAHKVYDRTKFMLNDDFLQLYDSFVSFWDRPSDIVLRSTALGKSEADSLFFNNLNCNVHKMMACDLLTYLPDAILCKVERAAMSVSLETRVPFLDHRVVEFAWSLPLNYKLNKNVQKWIVKQILYKYLPERLMNRPKTGFGVPISEWLRGPLKEWASELLKENRIRQEGFFDACLISACWKEHIENGYDNGSKLWAVLMFQSWLDRQKSQ